MNQQEEPLMDQLAMFSTVKPMVPADDDVAPMCESARDRLAAAYQESPRHRRRLFAFALAGGSLLAAGAAAATVTLLAGPAHQDSSLRTFVTAAYTVRPDQDGTIKVTIKQLQDPAGLQRALTADGVPALVRYIPARNVSGTYDGTTYNGISPVCQYGNLQRVPGTLGKSVGLANGNTGTAFWIRPRALPKGSVVLIQDTPGGPGAGGSIAGIDVLRSGKLPRCVPVKPPSPQQIVSPHS